MAEGFSKPWQEAIDEMTGSPVMSASSFIKYFSPLYDFLEQENTANGACIGWGAECEKKAIQDIDNYNSKKGDILEFWIQTDWEYYTSISEESQDASNEAAKILAAFEKESWSSVFTQYDYETFENY